MHADSDAVRYPYTYQGYLYYYTYQQYESKFSGGPGDDTLRGQGGLLAYWYGGQPALCFPCRYSSSHCQYSRQTPPHTPCIYLQVDRGAIPYRAAKERISDSLVRFML